MKTLKLKDNFYWTGVIDEKLRVFDIIMYTEFGTTYNSYLLNTGEKTVLFETVKEKFFDDYIKEIKSITDIENIEYLVVSHTEPDHAGSIQKLVELNPNIKVIATNTAISFLKNIVNADFYNIAIQNNQEITIGNKTLQFIQVPNLHWPDTMYTYIKEDGILVTCDSFGSHYAFDEILRSKVVDVEGYMRATKYYFDNIIGPFKPYMLEALDRIRDLNISMICTGHGPVIDDKIDEIMDIYQEWCTDINPNTRKTVIIPYVSAYGYTAQLADNIAKGVRDSGEIDVRCYDMVEADFSKVMDDIKFADGLLLGSPTILAEALKPIWDITTSMFSGVHGGKYASAFGSYGWSGEAVPHLLERLKQLNMKVLDEGFTVKFKPNRIDLINAYEFGYNFGCNILQKEKVKKQTGPKKLVKCLVCGEVFDASIEICPVCGVGKENFVEVDEEIISYKNDTNESFVILGNGIAGLMAADSIRKRNSTAKITMISNEDCLTYNRPMLTKTMLAKLDVNQILVNPESWYRDNNINTILNRTVIEINAHDHVVILDYNENIHYDKLIYALGSECFIPPIIGADKNEVIAIRRFSDIQKLNDLLPKVNKVVVIGGGVLGLEAAWEFKKSKCDVTVLELAPQLMGRQIDVEAAKMLELIALDQDIKILTGVQIESIEGTKHVDGVKLSDETIIPADLVIISAGVRANTLLAKEAGIAIDRAIVVNEFMETNVKDIFACGDCVQYEGMNYAIWPEAAEQGKVAGAVATGDYESYQVPSLGLSFHGMNTALYAIGDNGKNPNLAYRTMEIKDLQKRYYEKYYFVNNQLKGAILIGDISKMTEIMKNIK